MPIDVARLTAALNPEETVLLFGAGSSLPSGAPSVRDLQLHFEHIFDVSAEEYELAEQTGIIEATTRDRGRLISALREKFGHLKPTGALLNLPLFNWKSIYTTNYDDLIEQSYARKSRPVYPYSSNFDFKPRREPNAVQLFKLHGTINEDVSDGKNSRIILTQHDYDVAHEFRERLYDRFKSDLGEANLVIIGHSLTDPDIRSAVDRALQIYKSAGGYGRITLLIYKRDEGRGTLFENRGLDVCFGGLDDFFAGLNSRIAPVVDSRDSSDPLDRFPAVRPATIDVNHAIRSTESNISSMFNGWPATYADIAAQFTFPRIATGNILKQFQQGEKQVAIILGPSGVGKTTAARQALSALNKEGYLCWEHKIDQTLLGHFWRQIGRVLQGEGRNGCVLLDEAHLELAEINDLVDGLAADGSTRLRLIICSSKSHWGPRVKTPALHRRSLEHYINKVQSEEIDALLTLVETNPSVGALVENRFSGFSRPERRRRLVERCEADMFVCLKNIFASEKLDDIILREFATLPFDAQEVYRTVAAMEYAGVRVHRQLIIRLLGVAADRVKGVLDSLTDIIHEQTVNAREGVYAWYGRHKVIMGIVAEHKYYDQVKRFDLFQKVIDNIQPTYDLELRTIRELCNVETGLSTISDREAQNVLLRKMISVAPRERVPRHRLIRNLVALQKYDDADTEIRLFERDFKMDGPASRYKIDAALSRAVNSPGLMTEDRIVLLSRAQAMANPILDRFRYNKGVIASYCELGLAMVKLSGNTTSFEHGITLLRGAEEQTSDPDISRLIARLERKLDRIRQHIDMDESLLDYEDAVPVE